VSLRDVVRMDFNGAQRNLCCHGCEAVLLMVESNGLMSDYLLNKDATQPLTP